LDDIKRILREIGQQISAHGTPANRPPLITAFLGKGKTSHGAQTIYDLLPAKEISLSEVAETFRNGDRRFVYKLVLHIPELYRLRENDAQRRAELGQDGFSALYKAQPELFESNLEAVFPYLTLLMNCVLWSPKYPRLLTRKDAHAWWQMDKTLEVIGDISCDPDGSVQFSRETWVTNPVFVYNPDTDQDADGFEGEGIAVMAITNLPCEFSADASQGFCENLQPFLAPLSAADFSAPDPASAGLPSELARATILWQGQFTPAFRYMEAYLEPQLAPIL
jgi:alpha-aminoadipic semialdehyde synthase